MMTNIFGEGNLIHEFDLDRLPQKDILEQIKAHSRSLGLSMIEELICITV